MHLQFGLFSILTSGPQLVYQRLWYVLSCLWESAYKRSLLLIRKSSLWGDSRFPLKKYVTMTLCLMLNSWLHENQCALDASLNNTNFRLNQQTHFLSRHHCCAYYAYEICYKKCFVVCLPINVMEDMIGDRLKYLLSRFMNYWGMVFIWLIQGRYRSRICLGKWITYIKRKQNRKRNSSWQWFIISFGHTIYPSVHVIQQWIQ